MKKLLLTLTLLLGLFASASAESQTTDAIAAKVDMKNDGGLTTVVNSGPSINIYADQGNGSNVSFSSSQLRLSDGNTLTISISDGYVIEKIVMTFSSAGYALTSERGTVDNGSFSCSSTTATWTLDTPAQQAVFTASAALRFKTFTITYSEVVAADAVAKPIIDMDYDNNVTISHSDENAVIYYTTNGEDPTTDSDKYTEAFSIAEETTVKAIAVVGEKSSDIVSATLTPYVTYANIAEVKAAFSATSETIFKVKGPLTVAYQNSVNTYVTDADGYWTLIYDKGNTYVPTGLVNGDKLDNIICTYNLYNGTVQLIPVVSFTKGEAGDAVDATVVSIADITNDMQSAFIKLEGVNISETSSTNTYTISDADENTLQMFNKFSLDISVANNVNILGFVNYYSTSSSSSLQVYPIEIDASAAREVCAIPTFSVENGRVEANTEVTISCSTEGATIYYTTDGTDPNAESSVYTEPIVITVTTSIKAIAIKDGMDDSPIASAYYTVIDANTPYASFDFTDPSSLYLDDETVVVTPASDSNTLLTDSKIVLADVTLSFVKGDASAPCIYNSSGTCDLRLYYNANSDQTMTISVAKAKEIISVEFTKAGGNFAFTANKGKITTDGNNATWAPIDEDDQPVSTTEIVLTTTGKARISTMTVFYVLSSDAVNDIAVDSEDAAVVEYYNLQGVRVANPTPGLYIVRQGTKVAKQLIR